MPSDDCCPVCAEAVGKRAQARCPTCAFEACRACHQRYLLGSANDPHCMSCRVGWSSEVVEQLLTRAFAAGKLRDHRRRVLLDRERSMLPQVQAEIEVTDAQQAADRTRSRWVRARRLFVNLAKANVDETPLAAGRDNDDERVAARIDAAFRDTRAAERAMQRAADLYRSVIRQAAPPRSAAPAKERREFVRGCPADGCRGFLSNQWRCGLCGARACPRCHEDLPREAIAAAEQHVCREDMLLSAQAVAADSKPCPTCGARIHRVSGCAQMWCTQCRTAFDWTTLRKIGGAVHNPHYFEFMASIGGNDDNRAVAALPHGGAGGGWQCAVVGNPASQRQLLERIAHIERHSGEEDADKGAARAAGATVRAAVRGAAHIRGVTHLQFQRLLDPRANRHIAAEYLRKNITEAEFARRLQLGERAREHARAVIGLLEATAGAVDVLAARLAGSSAQGDLVAVAAHLARLREAHNGHMDAVQARFKLKTVVISEDWSGVRVLPGKRQRPPKNSAEGATDDE